MAHLSEAIRYTRDSGNTASVTANYLAAYPAGTFVAIAVNAPVSGTWTNVTITDSAGNTYAVAGAFEQGTPVNYELAILYCKLTNAVATGTTLTATVTGASPAKWMIVGHAFDDDVQSLDVTAHANGSSGSPSSGATAAANRPNQLLIGAAGFTNSNPAGLTYTSSAGWADAALATASPASAARSLGFAWRAIDTSGTRTYSGTVNPSQGWGALIAAFNLPAVNLAPTVDLTASTTLAESLSTVTLTATATDSDGTIASYVFTQTAGPTVTLSGSGSTRTFEAPAIAPADGDQTLTFSVTVTDDDGATASDTVSIVVPVHCQWWYDGATLKPRLTQHLTD